MTRKEARETAMCLLFEQEFRAEETPEEIYEISLENREIEDDEYLRRVFFGINENREQIDSTIGKHSRGWKTERLSRVSRAVCRIAVYEMLFEKDIPAPVSINEAIELAHTYSTPEAASFINGILGSVSRAPKGE